MVCRGNGKRLDSVEEKKIPEMTNGRKGVRKTEQLIKGFLCQI